MLSSVKSLIERERWIAPVVCIVAFSLVFACLAGLGVGYYALPPIFGYIRVFSTFLVLIFGFFVLWQVIALRGVANPTRTLIAKLMHNRDLVSCAGIGLSLMVLQFAALTWAKPTLPMIAGFWADPVLANADAALFGTDAWRPVHAVIGPRNFLIDTVYGLWFPVIIGALFFTFISRNPVKSPLIVAFFLTITIGMLLQFALPSAGPIFWGRLGFEDRFAELLPAIPPQAMQGSGFLWGCHVGYRECIAGWGISAWPSMHVALATWVVFAAAMMKRSLLPLALGWWAMIFLGSIYLGWHYVLDSVAGALLVAMAWAIQGGGRSIVTSRFRLAR